MLRNDDFYEMIRIGFQDIFLSDKNMEQNTYILCSMLTLFFFLEEKRRVDLVVFAKRN